jgi:hypothetical protein
MERDWRDATIGMIAGGCCSQAVWIDPAIDV